MICANSDCAKDFDSKTHNQKYCCDECCRVATNKKIMEKYYEKKAIRLGAPRQCKKCGSQLSRYNNSNKCSRCEKNSSIKYRESLIELINDAGKPS